MYKSVKEISARYDSKEIVTLENRVDCYTWCYPIDFKEFDSTGIWKENETLMYEPSNLTMYIHVPYCKFICSMCPFTHIVPNKSDIDTYVQALIKEIQFYSKHFLFKKVKVTSLYFGGGTASLLSPSNLEDILEEINKNFDLAERCQITLECHPKTVDENYLNTVKKLGINRVSFGIQSFNQNMLNSLKLRQNAEENIDLIKLAKQIGFQSVAADIMYNFPSQSAEELEKDVRTAIKLGLNNLSFYAIDPEVRNMDILQNEIAKEKEMYYMINRIMTENEYLQIAQPDYSLSKFENQQIIDLWGMPQAYNIGFGAGAFSENFNGYIWANLHDPKRYVECIEKNNIPVLMGKKMTEDDQLSRFPALGVRMLKFKISDYNRAFGVEFTELFKYEIMKLEEIGYIEIKDDLFCVTKKGSFYIDNISKMFFSLSNRGKTQVWGCNLINVLPERVYSMDLVK